MKSKSNLKPCYYCGKDCRKHGDTRDHIWPRCRGGNQTVQCCGPCNQLKGRLSAEEFRWVMAYRHGHLKGLKLEYKFYGEAGVHPVMTTRDLLHDLETFAEAPYCPKHSPKGIICVCDLGAKEAETTK